MEQEGHLKENVLLLILPKNIVQQLLFTTNKSVIFKEIQIDHQFMTTPIFNTFLAFSKCVFSLDLVDRYLFVNDNAYLAA